jgi:hypothetical protein
MMREGRLLAEAHPNHLMKELALPTLEEAFLYLCRNEDPSGAHTRILTLSSASGSTNADTPDDNDASLPLLSKPNVQVRARVLSRSSAQRPLPNDAPITSSFLADSGIGGSSGAPGFPSGAILRR